MVIRDCQNPQLFRERIYHPINCRGREGDRPRAVASARDMTVKFREAIGALEAVPHTL
jgi:hypothetical protein